MGFVVIPAAENLAGLCAGVVDGSDRKVLAIADQIKDLMRYRYLGCGLLTSGPVSLDSFDPERDAFVARARIYRRVRTGTDSLEIVIGNTEQDPAALAAALARAFGNNPGGPGGGGGGRGGRGGARGVRGGAVVVGAGGVRGGSSLWSGAGVGRCGGRGGGRRLYCRGRGGRGCHSHHHNISDCPIWGNATGRAAGVAAGRGGARGGGASRGGRGGGGRGGGRGGRGVVANPPPGPNDQQGQAVTENTGEDSAAASDDDVFMGVECMCCCVRIVIDLD
ncbi:hypothetical protein BDZ85DRAFT_251219 [Elsinoe ampelina]|uniref:Uncharacterized protein n=1 Tax=Elsinoe ampelina TaxID=302913 RepID=A0A6A6G712_9PEZI|nr:hypothetical protein BDZ85DRAFT_251219 [Elsinoe ampelina]